MPTKKDRISLINGTLRLPIRYSHRICFFGRTGSGKSTRARGLLSQFPNFIVLDPKHMFDMPGVKVVRSHSPFLKRQIVRAPVGDNEHAIYMKAVDWAYKKKNIVIYFDEICEHTNARVLPKQIARAIKMGRGRNVGVWIGSQRPKDIPSPVFTEAEHFFLGRLSYEDDRKKVVRFTTDGLGEYMETLRGFDNLYYNLLLDQGVMMRDTG